MLKKLQVALGDRAELGRAWPGQSVIASQSPCGTGTGNHKLNSDWMSLSNSVL
jgi:hypothetical protein